MIINLYSAIEEKKYRKSNEHDNSRVIFRKERNAFNFCLRFPIAGHLEEISKVMERQMEKSSIASMKHFLLTRTGGGGLGTSFRGGG